MKTRPFRWVSDDWRAASNWKTIPWSVILCVKACGSCKLAEKRAIAAPLTSRFGYKLWNCEEGKRNKLISKKKFHDGHTKFKFWASNLCAQLTDRPETHFIPSKTYINTQIVLFFIYYVHVYWTSSNKFSQFTHFFIECTTQYTQRWRRRRRRRSGDEEKPINARKRVRERRNMYEKNVITFSK